MKLKIGIVCYPTVGGSGVVATELGKLLAEKGHEIHFISSSMPFRLNKVYGNIYYHEVNVNQYSVFQYPPYDLALANKIAAVAKRERLDVLHAHYAVPHAVCAVLARQMVGELPIVTTLHGTDFVDERVYRRREAGHLRREYGISEQEKVVIHVSNFRKVKRVPDVVRAFAIVRRHMPAKLLLVGDGPEMTVVCRLVKELGLNGDVRFLGKQDKLEELYSISDVMMLLSEKESFGLVLLEAMACGVPCIGTAIGGIPEVIEDGKSGFLCPLGDVEEAARRTIMLLTDRRLHQEMARQAVQTVEQKFRSSDIVGQYEQLYISLAARKVK